MSCDATHAWPGESPVQCQKKIGHDKEHIALVGNQIVWWSYDETKGRGGPVPKWYLKAKELEETRA